MNMKVQFTNLVPTHMLRENFPLFILQVREKPVITAKRINQAITKPTLTLHSAILSRNSKSFSYRSQCHLGEIKVGGMPGEEGGLKPREALVWQKLCEI